MLVPILIRLAPRANSVMAWQEFCTFHMTSFAARYIFQGFQTSDFAFAARVRVAYRNGLHLKTSTLSKIFWYFWIAVVPPTVNRTIALPMARTPFPSATVTENFIFFSINTERLSIFYDIVKWDIVIKAFNII